MSHHGSQGSSAIVLSLISLVQYFSLMCILLVWIFFLGISCVQKKFCGYFVGPRFFHMCIFWIQVLFLCVLRGIKFFHMGTCAPNFFLVGSKFSVAGNFVISSCWWYEQKWHRNISENACSIPNRFQQLGTLFIWEKYFIYQITYAITQL